MGAETSPVVVRPEVEVDDLESGDGSQVGEHRGEKRDLGHRYLGKGPAGGDGGRNGEDEVVQILGCALVEIGRATTW